MIGFLKILKKIWNKDPKFFISDECNEIISGKKVLDLLTSRRY